MRSATAPLVAAAALVAGCGQPLLSARVDIPEIRISEAPQAFPAASIDPSTACSFIVPTPPSCVAQALAYDIGQEVPVLKQKGVTVDLRLTDVELELVAGGASSLRGIIEAEVDLRDPATGGFVKVASYVRPSPTSTPSTISVSGSSNLELSPFLSGGRLDGRIAVQVDPTQLPSGFTATLDAGFSLVVTLDYSSYL
jgi:hypothetical protein